MTFLTKGTLRTTITKPTRIIFLLVGAVAVVSVGYITALAILAPEQLAEATGPLLIWYVMGALVLLT